MIFNKNDIVKVLQVKNCRRPFSKNLWRKPPHHLLGRIGKVVERLDFDVYIVQFFSTHLDGFVAMKFDSALLSSEIEDATDEATKKFHETEEKYNSYITAMKL